MRNPKQLGAFLLLLGRLTWATEAATPEERKAEFAKPRGLSKSSSSKTTSSSQPVEMPAVAETYKKMGETFSKEMNQLTKNFTVPKISEEPNYLEQLNQAQESIKSNTSWITQYTDAFISTLQLLTKMQIDYDLSKSTRDLKISKASPFSMNPSPISLRTRISGSKGGASKGLFPNELDSITSKAYNPPK